MNVPAPHNEKQTMTIASFSIRLTDEFPFVAFIERRPHADANGLEIFLPSASHANDRRNDAHQCSAILDSNWKILRHAQRTLRQLAAELLLERIAQFPNLHKKFPRVFRF